MQSHFFIAWDTAHGFLIFFSYMSSLYIFYHWNRFQIGETAISSASTTQRRHK